MFTVVAIFAFAVKIPFTTIVPDCLPEALDDITFTFKPAFNDVTISDILILASSDVGV